MAISLGVVLSRDRRACLKSYLSLVAVAVPKTHLLKIRFRPNLKILYLVWTLAPLLITLKDLKLRQHKLTSTLFWAFKAKTIMRNFKIYFKATKLWWRQHFIVLTLKISLKGSLQCSTRFILQIQMNRKKYNRQRPIRISEEEEAQQKQISNQEGSRRKKGHRLTLLTLRRLILLSSNLRLS
jgi:hypothetical protein